MAGRAVGDARAHHAFAARAIATRRARWALAVADAFRAKAVRHVADRLVVGRVRAVGVVVAFHAKSPHFVARRRARRAIVLFVAADDASPRRRLASLVRAAVGVDVALDATLVHRVASRRGGGALRVVHAGYARSGYGVAVQRRERAICVGRTRPGRGRVDARVDRPVVETHLPVAPKKRGNDEARHERRARCARGAGRASHASHASHYSRSARMAAASDFANPFGHRAR